MTGTGTLLRLMVRRDRVRSLLWILGIAAMAFYVTQAVQLIAEDEEELRGLATLFTDPVGRMMVGPGFGMDAPTYERFFAAGYALFVHILMALMAIFTVVRHTRADEQAGRAELLRANVVGRHATLTAALLLTLALTLISAALIFAAQMTAGYAWEGALLTAVSSASAAVFFAGLASVTAQLSEASRGASGLAGAMLGLAYLVRMGGDAAQVGGSALSWASPLGWSQQTAPFVDDLWWPLLPLAGGGAVLALAGFWLSTRRDVEAGLLPVRLGRAEAPAALGTPLGFAARSLRGTLRGWTIALVVAALMFGAYAQSIIDSADALPAELAQVFAGDDLLDGFVSYMALFMAVFVTAAAVSALQQVRGEEIAQRAEYLLSAPVSRTSWLGAHLAVAMVGALLMLTVVGVTMGVAVAVSLEANGGSHFTDVLVASLLPAPAVLATLGLVTAFFGWLPRLMAPVGWVLVGFAGVMMSFGSLLDLPDVVLSLNLFHHLAEYPIEPIDWAAALWLTGVGAVGVVVGLIGWRRREVGAV